MAKNQIETTVVCVACLQYARTNIMTFLFISVCLFMMNFFLWFCMQKKKKSTNLWANDLVECCIVYRIIVSHRAAFIFDQKLWTFISLIVIADAAHLWTFTSIWWIRTVGIGTTATTTTATWARAITFAVFTACYIIMICSIRRNRSIVVCVLWRFVMWSMMIIMMTTVSTSDIGHLSSQFCEENWGRKEKREKWIIVKWIDK